MPLLESPPNALADVYATSLFEVCDEAGGREAVEETLGELRDLLAIAREDESFNEFLASRVLPNRKRADSLREILSGRVTARTLTFLLVLNDKDRLAHLPAMVAAFDKLAQAAFGRIDMDVYTAGPISGADLDAIRDRLAAALGKEVIAHHHSRPSIIGGLRLRYGDQLVDGSLATRLRRLRDQLDERGAARLRERVEQMIDAGAQATGDADDAGNAGG